MLSRSSIMWSGWLIVVGSVLGKLQMRMNTGSVRSNVKRLTGTGSVRSNVKRRDWSWLLGLCMLSDKNRHTQATKLDQHYQFLVSCVQCVSLYFSFLKFRLSLAVCVIIMAAMDDAPFSLLSLEDELSCSICLSPFECPVTIPCGHNFCQSCLLATWGDAAPYSCPQCRTHFATKPELKKNTVLNNVVATFKVRACNPESIQTTETETKEESPAPAEAAVRCDACMDAKATQTCLTCMASYCEEHLRPHMENPTFRLHQLTGPVGDLSDRICSEHHKLMELFCREHSLPICSFCLQQTHKGCTFVSPEEQRNMKEVWIVPI